MACTRTRTRMGITPDSVAEKLATFFKGWLCAVDDQAVGFCIADRENGELWVIAVLHPCDGRGIGGQRKVDDGLRWMELAARSR